MVTALYALAVSGGVLAVAVLTATAARVTADALSDVARFAAARWTR